MIILRETDNLRPLYFLQRLVQRKNFAHLNSRFVLKATKLMEKLNKDNIITELSQDELDLIVLISKKGEKPDDKNKELIITQIETISEAVAEINNTNIHDLKQESKNRRRAKQDVADIRFIIFRMCLEYIDYKPYSKSWFFESIAEQFNRDRISVDHGIRQAKNIPQVIEKFNLTKQLYEKIYV